MDVLINYEKKMICCALPRCGSNHVRIMLKNRGWVERRRSTLRSFDDYTVIKVIRDPYTRCMSWFYSFEWIDGIHNHWTVADAEKWLRDFRIQHHYDEHTGLQSVLYNLNQEYRNNNIYIKMEDIDLYFGNSDVPHLSGVQHDIRSSQLSSDVPVFLKKHICEIYHLDYHWIKNLDIWEKSS